MLTDGQILNSRYKIIRHLKSGGMGAVYEAFDTALKLRVVVKENICDGESLAFEREAQLLANLRHASLPHCSDYFSLDGKQYLVMEFVEGDDLSALMSKNRGPLKPETVMDWAVQLLAVLEYLHGEGILHRDIKPSNIKVIDGRVFLLDFGLAYGQSGDMDTVAASEFNWSCYSDYSPFEQLKCEHTYPVSDLYSLAATLYKLLTGVRPTHAATRSQSLASGEGDPLKDVRFLNPDLDRDVGRTIMRTLSMDPSKRPQSTRQMRRMMFPEKRSQIKIETPRPEPAAARKFPLRKAFVATLILCALFGLLALALADENIERAHTAPLVTEAPAPSVADSRAADEAERLKQRGKYEEARKILAKLIASSPGNAYWHYLYADLLWDMLDELAESVASMTEVQWHADIILRLVQSPKSEKEFTARAWAYLAKRQLDLAQLDVEEALRLNPDSAPCLILRGTIKYLKAGLASQDSLKSAVGEILGDYGRAIDKMRDYPQAYINRAQIHAGLGDFKAAVADIERAISLRPETANFYFELGNVHYRSGNFEEAGKNFQTAVRKNPNCYKAYVGLADIFFFRGKDYKNALATYLSANKIHETAYTFGQIGQSYICLGRFKEAKDNFTSSLRLNKHDFFSRQGLARSDAALGEFDSALDSYNQVIAEALENDPKVLESLYRERAAIYRGLGREELATEDEKQADGLSQ